VKRPEYFAFKSFAYAICRFLIRTLYRLEIVGPREPIHGPAIIVANHRHAFDVVAVHTAVKPWIYWVAKKELFTKSLSGRMVVWLGCIPVDRNRVDLIAAKGIFGHLRDGDLVGIFPQGTRVPDALIDQSTPHNGAVHFAIKTGVPIIPVAVDRPFRLFHKVRVVFGEPFSLAADPGKRYTADELNVFTQQMMQSIYRLIGMDYQINGKKADNRE
jgi:1-acyl-sn-glycerol-3-phosphate acyltransferase